MTAWQILVSEFMLQQTPVARVAPIWRDWVTRWPTPSATAAASAADVLRAWGKLGYPRRAKWLHECAIAIAAEHGDEVPDDVDTLLSLPGIGSYTARAVACFAYGRRVPVVDTNVRRVVARAVHGRADLIAIGARPHRRAALLPDDACRAAVFGRPDGARRDGLHGARAALRPLSAERLRVASVGFPPATSPPSRLQTYAGTDRQVRGRLLDVLRGNAFPVTRASSTWRG